MFATPSCFAIWERLRGLLLYRCVEVREITFKSAILARRVRISSWMPSAKYALSFSSLKFSNGSTAMLFSGIKTVALLAVPSGGVDGVILSDTRWKKVKELITIARAATAKASTSRDLGRRGRLTGRTMSDSCFHLLLRLSLSGTCGLPRFSLQRLNMCRRNPCFTSHSPRSCRYGCQCRYCAKSHATCPDKRICPASPQSSTRCATLIPDPAKFVLSLTSLTRLTGPL